MSYKKSDVAARSEKTAVGILGWKAYALICFLAAQGVLIVFAHVSTPRGWASAWEYYITAMPTCHISSICYLLTVLFFERYVEGSRHFEQYMIVQRPRMFDLETAEWANVIPTMLAVLPCLHALMAQFLDLHNRDEVTPKDLNIVQVGLEVFGFFYVHNIIVGVWHLLSHVGCDCFRLCFWRLGTTFHKTHHRAIRTSAVLNTLNHDVDGIGQSLITAALLVLAAKCCNVRYWSILISLALIQSSAAYNHSNYDIWYCPFEFIPFNKGTARHHVLHHAYPTKNYFAFPILDRMLGTELQGDPRRVTQRTEQKSPYN